MKSFFTDPSLLPRATEADPREAKGTVAVSVLMPAYNAEAYLLQSVQSVLGQTFEDLELLVIDDSSTDGTAEILASVRDRRLRVVRNYGNAGIVGSLNRALPYARGRYIARMDADDYCLPTRIAKQKRYLDRHPEVVLVGTEMADLDSGVVKRGPPGADPDPTVLRWQFLVANPIGHPTMMFRADAVQRLGVYLREEFRYAEDFDFSHRMWRIGTVAVLPEYLGIYRRHRDNVTRTRYDEMVAVVAAVLADAYRDLFGEDAAEEAVLGARHLVARIPARDVATLRRVAALLERLVTAFLAAREPGEDRAARIMEHAGRLWWKTVQASLRAGVILPAAFGHNLFRGGRPSRPALHRIARSAAGGLLERAHLLPARSAPDGQSHSDDRAAIQMQGVRLEPVQTRPDDPPTLYVVVDADTEFDWSEPLARSPVPVRAMSSQELSQAIFEPFGLRPLYVVDYAVASQAEGYQPLRRIFDRHACLIGAQLHPWINPPFEEEPSYGGNLPPDLEARKLRVLVNTIRENLGISPLFFKAGRYGLGPRTLSTLAQLGVRVDFSLLPGVGLSARGGVDFRPADAQPYRDAASGILSVPMSRGMVGPLTALRPRLSATLQSPLLTSIDAPGILARLGLANIVTLTPEGVSTRQQIQLIRSMARRGHRTFVLHYHSPSLVPGFTPHVATAADLELFLRRLREVCDYFFDVLGGLPGNPADLLPQHLRERVWPDRTRPMRSVA